MNTRTKTLAWVAAVLLALGLVPPTSALAAPVTTQAQLTISNTANGTPVTGATYTITQTHTVDPNTGIQTAFAGTPITVNAGDTTNLDQYAVYAVQQATRAPGHYLDPTTYAVEFPLLAGGAPATSQAFTITPKIIPVTGTATLLKTANGSTTPLPGATFRLVQTGDAAGPITPTDVATGLVTGADGTISAVNLPEGTYYFVETAAPTGYALDTTTQYPFTVTVDAAGTATAPITQSNAINYTEPSASTVTKLVNGAGTTTVSIGQEVTFTITVDVPLDIADYSTFTITDALDPRFTLGDVTTPDGIAATMDGNAITLTGTPAEMTPGPNTITITATVNNTTGSGDSIPNTASVAWDNGKGDSGTFDTGTVTVTWSRAPSRSTSSTARSCRPTSWPAPPSR